jgi:hypothetical protein
MLLPSHNLASDSLAKAATGILNRETRPGNLLAQAQLELHIFDSTRALGAVIEEQLKQEPQNPMLLLAKATLYPPDSQSYKTYHQQGFELARRLQDTEALQAFRVEELVQSQVITRRVMNKQGKRFGKPSIFDLMGVIHEIAREATGADVPPEILAKMIPTLFSSMDDAFLQVDDDDEEAEGKGGAAFMPPPPSGKQQKASRKRKPWYKL